jgi:hypothetical protein
MAPSMTPDTCRPGNPLETARNGPLNGNERSLDL